MAGAVEIVKSVLTLDTSQYNEAMGKAKNGAMDLVKTLGPKVGVAGALAIVGKYIVENTKEMYEFNKTLTRGNSELRNNTEALNAYSKRLTKVARDASMSYNAIGLAQEYARKEGYNLNESLKVTEASAQLANATNESLEGTTSALVGTMKAFNIEAENATKANDALGFVLNNTTWSSSEVSNSFRKLGNEARLAGMSIEDMSIFLVNQSNAGVDSRRAMRNLESAIKGNGDIVKASTSDIQNYNNQMGTVAKDAVHNKTTFMGEIQRWSDLNKEVLNVAGSLEKATIWMKNFNDRREENIKSSERMNELIQIEKDLSSGLYGTDYNTPLQQRKVLIMEYNDAVEETNKLYLENQKLVQSNIKNQDAENNTVKTLKEYNDEKLKLQLSFIKDMAKLKSSGGSDDDLKKLEYDQQQEMLKNDLDFYSSRDDMEKEATQAEIALIKHGMSLKESVNNDDKQKTEDFNNSILALQLDQITKLQEIKKDGLLSDNELKQLELTNQQDILEKQLAFYESQKDMQSDAISTRIALKQNEISQQEVLAGNEISEQEKFNIEMLNMKNNHMEQMTELSNADGITDVELNDLQLQHQQEELEAKLEFYQSQEDMLAETLQTQLELKQNALDQQKALDKKKNLMEETTSRISNTIATKGKQALDKVLSDAIAGRVTNIAELGKALSAEVSQQAISGATQATIDGFIATSTGHVLASNPVTAPLAPNAFLQAKSSFAIAGQLGALGAVTGLVSSAIPGGESSSTSTNENENNRSTSVSDTTDSIISSTSDERQEVKVIRVGGVEAITTLIDKFLGNKYNTTITGKRR